MSKNTGQVLSMSIVDCAERRTTHPVVLRVWAPSADPSSADPVFSPVTRLRTGSP